MTVQKEMINTLTHKLKTGNTSFAALAANDKTAKKEWILDQPSQIVLTVDKIQWSSGTVDALEGMADNEPESLTHWLAANDD